MVAPWKLQTCGTNSGVCPSLLVFGVDGGYRQGQDRHPQRAGEAQGVDEFSDTREELPPPFPFHEVTGLATPIQRWVDGSVIRDLTGVAFSPVF